MSKRKEHKNIIKTSACLVLFMCLQGLAHAETLLITSWNMNKLTHPSTPGSSRTSDQIRTLNGAAKRMGADIIAMQEVSGARTALDVFGQDYKYYMGEKGSDGLRVGFAVSDRLTVEDSYQYTPLRNGGGRVGVDITVSGDDGDKIRLLNVHLAEGCEKAPLPSSKKRECKSIDAQSAVLSEWVGHRKREGVPFMILGTFGRYLGVEQVDPYPGLLSKVNGNYEQFVDGLKTVSGDKRPGCWDSRRPDFVDHFLVDPLMEEKVVGKSFREAGYGGKWNRANEKKYSDHCPIRMMVRM